MSYWCLERSNLALASVAASTSMGQRNSKKLPFKNLGRQFLPSRPFLVREKNLKIQTLIDKARDAQGSEMCKYCQLQHRERAKIQFQD